MFAVTEETRINKMKLKWVNLQNYLGYDSIINIHFTVVKACKAYYKQLQEHAR